MSIKNRYEVEFYVACWNGNPNGDPDNDNSPRMDDDTNIGLISDGAIKRRIRNYISLAHAGEERMDILMQTSVNLNRLIAEAKEEAGVAATASDKKSVEKGRLRACERFFDVRTFGAVMSTGPNAGQVRGPVQFTFGRSLSEITPTGMSITRVCSAEDVKGKANPTAADFAKAEETSKADKLRTMGRKYYIPFGLYEVRAFISANLADDTGFDERDLSALFDAIYNMYEHDRSASKGEMAVVSPLIIFKHTGLTDAETNTEENERSAKLGCAPAHKLFELVSVVKKPEVECPRDYHDYNAHVALDRVPRGVQVGFYDGQDITWWKLPENEDWFN